jgi:hypothetical protein
MKAASGDTESGGDIKPWPIVEGRSLERLCVRDRIFWGGDKMPDDDRDMACSKLEKDMTESVGDEVDLYADSVIRKTIGN